MKIVKELIPANDPFRLPSESGTYEVTPEMASSWLSYRRHPSLRNLSPITSARYQEDMEAVPSRWYQNSPEGLIFDTEGWIISAQHRLKAQANAGLTLRWRIYVNESRELSSYLEQGRRRSAADMIAGKYRTQVTAGARHLAALADGDEWGMPRYNKISVPEVVLTHGKWPELTWHLTEVMACQFEAGVLAGPHLAVLAQAERTEYRDKIPAWLEGVRTGFDLTAGDARAHLRNRFRTGLQSLGKVNRRDQAYALIAKAWNAFAVDESVNVLRFAVTEELPKVIDYTFSTEKEGEAA